MKKLVKLLPIVVLILSGFAATQLVRDKQVLGNDLIRLHVVANSDSDEDQAIKLAVKDSVVSYLKEEMAQINSSNEAKAFLLENLQNIEQHANEMLKQLNLSQTAKVSFRKEAFGKREYDTFALPSGVYESLRIELGNADGKNWWCVVFPSLCLPATTDGFNDVAVSSGFEQDLTATLSGENGYEFRFFLLDCIGKVENFFYFH